MTNNTTAPGLTDEQRKAVEFAIELIENDRGDRTVTSRTLRALLTSPRAAVPAIVEAIASQWDDCMFEGIGHDINIGASIRDAYRRLDAAPAGPGASPSIDIEQMLRDCVPGGDIVDPQLVCDNIRGWFADHAQAVAADGAAGGGWPMLSKGHLESLMFAYNEGWQKAYDGREFANPFAETGSQAAAWELGTRDGKERRKIHARAAVPPATAEQREAGHGINGIPRAAFGPHTEADRIDHCGSCGAENDPQKDDVCPVCHAECSLVSTWGEFQHTRYRNGQRYANNGPQPWEDGPQPATADERAAALVPASYAAPLKRAMDLLDRKLGDTDPNIEGMGQEEIEQTYPVFAAMRIIVALHDEASQAAAWELGTRDGKERRKIHARAAVSPATADTTWTAPKQHCQNGGDVCLAGNHDGVCCPEDSCDIDDGTRKNPSVLPIKIPHVHIRPEDEEIGRQYYALGFVDGSRSITDAPQPATADEQRAAFEAEVSEKSGLSCACDVRGRYIDPTVRGMWEARQAERASQAAAPQANAAEESEDAYVIRRLSETLADVAVTLRGDDPVHPDDPLNKIELVKRLAKVLRMEVELYRAQAAAPADAREPSFEDAWRNSGRHDTGLLSAMGPARWGWDARGRVGVPADTREPDAYILPYDLEVLKTYSAQCQVTLYREPRKTRVALYAGRAPADAGEAVAMTQAELDAQPDWIKNALPPEGA